MTIGSNIKRYRKEKKISQAKLSELIGKSKSSIEKYESDKVVPSLSILADIASVLDIEINDLTNTVEKLANDYVSNMSDDELLAYKNRIYYKNELANKELLYDKLEPKQLEFLYLSKIESLNAIIEIKDQMIENLDKMIETKDQMIENLDKMIENLEKINTLKDDMINK